MFAKTKTRAFLEGVDPPQAPDKGQHGFSSSEHDDESGKEVSIRRAGLNNSSKGPSLGPLTRECNLLAPARCTPRAHRDSLPYSLPVVHTRSWRFGLGSLYPPPFGLRKLNLIINYEDERSTSGTVDASIIKIRH